MEQMTDLQREAAIDDAAIRLNLARTQAERRAAWVDLSRLIAGRSSRQVTIMEQDKGLSPSPLG